MISIIGSLWLFGFLHKIREILELRSGIGKNTEKSIKSAKLYQNQTGLFHSNISLEPLGSAPFAKQLNKSCQVQLRHSTTLEFFIIRHSFYDILMNLG